ncbi:MAG: histidinol-phosphatase HisJ family protein [Clostridiales bacterium]|nr:histidinol-phosphatase HisJ family protein [Clostridiales bacterium]
MIANFHTHTVFCDGNNTPEEIILCAIDKGFSAIGFSGHGYTDFDLRYCMKETCGYIDEINRLKAKYKNSIQVYLGVEEDAFCLVDRSKFDYIIGSSHYFHIGSKYYPIDSNYDYFKKCLTAFNYDIERLAQTYYTAFCEYINRRKPDIIGHFDLITKFDELDSSLFLQNANYNKIAEKYITVASNSSSVFEVNTGAIARGLRTSAYPNENLLYILKKLDARLILSSDSHNIDTLDFAFSQTKAYLKDIGFSHLYTIYNGEFVKYDI